MTSMPNWDDNNQDSTDDTDQSDDQQTDSDTSGDNGAQAVASASPAEVNAHRNLIGDALAHLSDQGIDVDSLAEKAGVSSADVNELTHGDLANLTQYLSANHPEALQAVEQRFPEAQGLLGMLTGSGGGGGGIGGLLGRFLGH